MLGDMGEHVVEEPDARLNTVGPGAIQAQLQRDGRLGGRALDVR